MRSPSPEAQPQLEPDEVEERPCFPEPQAQLNPTDADDTARKVGTVASERDSSISRSEASDDGAATVTAKITAAKNKNRKPHNKIARSLTNKEEDDVIEWLKSNRFLYDKSSFEFKNRQKKDRTWLEMEQKMRLNPGDLYRWYTSLRTQYVKEVKKTENATRSGAGAVDDIVTPRISWLMEKFEFVKPYVCQARATRGSRIQKPFRHSDCSESSEPPQTTREGTPQSETSATTSTISDYLDKFSQQLAVPKSDIEKTCDFLSTL